MFACIQYIFHNCLHKRSNVDRTSCSIKWEDTVPFICPVQSGVVIKVYDGDTITIASKIKSESKTFRFSVRLSGIDSPEIRGKSEEERRVAQAAKQALSDQILNKYITMKNIKNEKYGRVLADVYINDLHLNQWMIDNNYAVPYNGGKKQHWSFDN